MALSKVTRKGQVTLPRAVREALRIEEGDYVEIELDHDAAIIRPKLLVDRDQAYYWSPAWQAAERRADEDIAAERVRRFDSVEELIADLDGD